MELVTAGWCGVDDSVLAWVDNCGMVELMTVCLCGVDDCVSVDGDDCVSVWR